MRNLPHMSTAVEIDSGPLEVRGLKRDFCSNRENLS